MIMFAVPWVVVAAAGVDIQTVLYLIFGAGFAGFITVLVTSYRRLKSGKIVDDESIIQRLHRELRRKDEQLEEADKEIRAERSGKNRALDDAAALRRQLIEAGMKPNGASSVRAVPEEKIP